jgi:aspartyl-tRNA(Asn)/glutamyl-tRNA(Gln) amidotransferase subunit A
MSVLKTLAAHVREVELPATIPPVIVGPEAYTFHAPYFTKTPDLYQPWTRERLKQAAAIATGAYIEGRRQLDQLRRTIGSVFTDVDLLVTPTCPVQPLTIDEVSRMEAPPPGGEFWMRNTRPFNAFGLPAVSIPCGVTEAGLPVGLQIAGPRFAESRVLAFAHAFERATQGSRRVPVL